MSLNKFFEKEFHDDKAAIVNETAIRSDFSSAIYQPPRGAGKTLTASKVGLIQLGINDIFYSDTTVWSDQLCTSALSGMRGIWANSNGSNSSYAWFASGFLQTNNICSKSSPASGSFTGYLSNFRLDNNYSDVITDVMCNIGDVGVISIKKIKFGESIVPHSFTAGCSGIAAGQGVVFVDSGSASNEYGIITRKSDGLSAGVIFYEQGIALIHGPSLTAIAAVSSLTSVFVRSTYKIWQLNAYCTAMPNELNYSSNDNAFYIAAITSNPEYLQDQSFTSSIYGYQWGINNDGVSANKGLYYLHEAFWKRPPYITSVGLYNDDGDLLAIAKLSQPVKKPDFTPITIRVSLDFD